MTRAEFLRQWMDGEFTEQARLRREMILQGIPVSGAWRYRVMFFMPDRKGSRSMSLPQKRACLEALGEACEQLPHLYACVLNAEALAVVAARIRQAELDALVGEITDLCGSFREKRGCSVTVGVGTTALAPVSLPESMKNARLASAYRVVYGPHQVISYEHIAMRSWMTPAWPAGTFREVLAALEAGDIDAFDRHLQALFGLFYAGSLECGHASVIHLLMELYTRMPEGSELSGVLKKLADCEFMDEEFRLVRAFAMPAFEEKTAPVPPQQNEKRKEQTEEILRFIDKNLSSPDLNINAIVSHSELSANTVRSLFREQGLPSPKDYVQELRMKEACRLLKQTELSAKDIAERVGFTDTRYFYVCFKKYAGKTTYEYRASAT